jgi:ribosomal protein L40E
MPNGEAAPAPMEEKLKTLSSKLAELEDLQLVNKLDMVNLKNEIENLKLTFSVPSPEALESIKELGKIAENAEVFSKLKDLARNVDRLSRGKTEGLEDMIRVVDHIDKRVASLETRSLGMKPEEAKEYAKRIEELRKGMEGLPGKAVDIKGVSSQIEKLRFMVEENTKNIWNLSKERRAAKAEAPKPKIHKRIQIKPEGVTCPKCRAALPVHAKFCGKCGAKTG